VEREDLPTRGIITFGPSDYEHSNQAHWETYLWSKFKAKRWGKYQVRLTYTLRRASLGMQFRIGDLVSKKPLKSSVTPRRMYLGTVHIQNAGDFPFSMITPPAEDGSFKLLEVALIPAAEGLGPKQMILPSGSSPRRSLGNTRSASAMVAVVVITAAKSN
jgi:hypothetical protein